MRPTVLFLLILSLIRSASADSLPGPDAWSVDAIALAAPSGIAPAAVDHDDPFTLAEEERRVQANIVTLRETGRYLPPAVGDGLFHPLFDWPLEDIRSGGFEPWFVGNFVDQDPAWPNQVLDYACGNRTYDTTEGYNHTGVDIALWPFPWRQKARGTVAVVAAAAGQIVDRIDGNPDDSCSLAGGVHNTVVLAHGDGSKSYYRHMKNGSVTAKQIGDTVARGERLGLVASSGNSTAPHLHFAARNDLEELIEPYAGLCNAQASGIESWWVEQPRYRPYALVDLMTHSSTPTIPPCPEVESPHFRRLFAADETVVIGAYFRDTTPESGTSFEVRRVDGTLHTSFVANHATTQNTLAAYWQFQLPTILLPSWRGAWTIRATSHNALGEIVVRERTFWVGVIFADDFERVSLTDAGWIQSLPLP
ncbi:MAG: M23 family metallopeptidase [Thermoanaerobaculia bacterium]